MVAPRGDGFSLGLRRGLGDLLRLIFRQALLELQRPGLDLRHLRGLDTLVPGVLDGRVAVERRQLRNRDSHGLLGGWRQARQDHRHEDHDPHEHRTK